MRGTEHIFIAHGEIVTRRFGPLRRDLEECLMSDHTIKAYDEELELLDDKIAEMGTIAEKLLSDAMESLFNFDADLAYATISGDLRLDILERDIEEQAIATIARRQPLAADFAKSSRLFGFQAISSALAISPRISPSGLSRSNRNWAYRVASSGFGRCMNWQPLF